MQAAEIGIQGEISQHAYNLDCTIPRARVPSAMRTRYLITSSAALLTAAARSCVASVMLGSSQPGSRAAWGAELKAGPQAARRGVGRPMSSTDLVLPRSDMDKVATAVKQTLCSGAASCNKFETALASDLARDGIDPESKLGVKV